MKTMKTTIASTLILAVLAAASGAAYAAGGVARAPEHVHWHFNGPLGKYDKAALQRGFQVYETVCSNCHGVDHLAFRHLGDRGGPFYLDQCPAGFPGNVDCSNPTDNPVVKAIAANYKFQVVDGPDDTGEMFERAGLPSDPVPGPFANEQIARLANNNALPPDLSLIAKARHHGPDYIYSLLTGYEDPPGTVDVAPGQYYNPYFHGDMAQYLKPEHRDAEGHAREGVEVPVGGVLAMAAPLFDGVIDYVDEDTPETVEQYAKDVAEFLAWAAEPKMEARKALGLTSFIYLVILAGLMYWSYRKIWSKIEH
jgi:ubiquinol-cytochrome c reductase cytochrome c1 subunit